MSKHPTTETLTGSLEPKLDSKRVYKGGVLGLMALRAVNGKSGTISEKVARRIIAKDSTLAGREVSPESMAKLKRYPRKPNTGMVLADINIVTVK